MDMKTQSSGDTLNVTIGGKFTFSDNGEFRKVLEQFSDDTIKNVTFDFSKLEFIDSAALGMMLLVKDESSKHNVKVSIKPPEGQPGQMFQVARFHDMFTIVS